MWCSFCQNCEHDSVLNELHLPHMPEFSTTRSFPGVRAGALASTVSLSVLTLLKYEESRPPTTPLRRGILPVTTAGSTNTKASTESTSILDKEERAHFIVMLYTEISSTPVQQSGGESWIPDGAVHFSTSDRMEKPRVL